MKIVKDELAEQQRTELAKAIATAAAARQAKDAATAYYVETEAEVQRLLKALGEKRANDGLYQVTLVEAERVKIDEEKLLRSLTREVRDWITDRKLNKSKLEDAVANGYVTAEWVAECATVEKNKPFVRFSLYEESDEDAG